MQEEKKARNQKNGPTMDNSMRSILLIFVFSLDKHQKYWMVYLYAKKNSIPEDTLAVDVSKN